VREGERPVVAFCGGSGITPVLSIAKSVLAGTGRSVRLFYANRDRHSVIFDEELRRMGDRHPGRFEVRHHYDVADGFPDVRSVVEFVGDVVDADFYLCGPAPFMDLVEGSLLGAGVELSSVLIERFVDGSADLASDDPDVDPPETVTLIMGGRKTAVAYQPGDTVLETARRGGLRPPFSCEAGNCATCMAMVRDGSAVMRVNNALTDEEVAEGWVLTCQALPRGPGTVTVEYEAF
jgi:ferredoxin-NADP reductase